MSSPTGVPGEPNTETGQPLLIEIEWTQGHPPRDARVWRRSVEESADAMSLHLDSFLQQIKNTGRRRPSYSDERRIIGGILQGDEDNRVRRDPIDQEDVARWLGRSVALAHRQMLSGMSHQTAGAKALYETFAYLLRESAALAWKGQEFPEWARSGLSDVPKSIIVQEKDLYRPWEDVSKALSIVLAEVFKNVKIEAWTPWESHEAIQGCQALRLAAGVFPGRVSDEMVDQLKWLERNIYSSERPPENTTELRQLIEITWERSLLERGVLETQTQDGTEAGSPQQRRRTL